ncbi:FAD-dependent oxidoreductase, partial [Cellulomonas triticagri]
MSETRPDAAPTSTSGTGEVHDALVVGGGVAGLVAARELALAGLRPLVVEAWRTAGGVVGVHEVDGLRLDAGAESFATRGGSVAALADELGLSDRVVTPSPHGAWVRLPHGAGPLPRTGLLGIPADPWAPDVRRTIGALGSLRASVDRLLPASVGTAPGGSLGSLVRTRAGRRVLDRLVRPVVAGVHAAEPDDVAVDAVAPGL